MIALRWAIAALLLAGCDAGVSGPTDGGQGGDDDDDDDECCTRASCGAGLLCRDCQCIPRDDCCVELDCGAQDRVCSGCTCVGADEDGDGDGWTADQDCDDGDGDVNPDAEEVCNGADDDCDRAVDEDGCANGSCCVGTCIATDDDPGNCGGCGVECDDGDFCTADRCEGGECVNDECGPGSDCCVPGPCFECCGNGDCDDGDSCTSDACSGGTCTHGDACGGGETCCNGGCQECCDDGDCGGGACCNGTCRDCCDDSDCGGDACCDGTCSECCDDSDCGGGLSCDGGQCVCGPYPHYQEVDGDCRPSCGIALDDAGYNDNGGGCCGTPCTLRQASPTWDCAYCCETEDGVPACQ